MRTLLVVGLLLADAALTWHASAQPVGYRAEVRVSGEAKRWPEMSLWTATVRDAAGKELYTLSKGIPYVIPFPSIAVSDVAPWSVVVSSCEGWVEFYDTTGTLVSTWAVFESRTPDYERIVKCALAGERIAFLVSEPAGRETRVFLADRGGNVSPYGNLPCATAGELWLSSNGSCLVAGCTSAGEQLEEDKKIKMWNPAAERMFGWRKAEVLGSPLPFVPPDKKAEVDALGNLVRKGKSFTDTELRCQRKDGAPIDIVISSAPLRDASGAVSDIMAVIIDTTLNRQLIQEILEISAREQRRIGQDLRDGLSQHLAGIAFLSKVLEEKLFCDSSSNAPQAKELTQLVHQAVEMTRNLAHGLLPVELEEDGLMLALEKLAATISPCRCYRQQRSIRLA